MEVKKYSISIIERKKEAFYDSLRARSVLWLRQLQLPCLLMEGKGQDCKRTVSDMGDGLRRGSRCFVVKARPARSQAFAEGYGQLHFTFSRCFSQCYFL